MLWTLREKLRGTRLEAWLARSRFAPWIRSLVVRWPAHRSAEAAALEWHRGYLSKGPDETSELPARLGHAESLFVLQRGASSPPHKGREPGTPSLQHTVHGSRGPSTERIMEQLARMASGSERHRLVVAVGNDDYTTNTGGIQVCIGEEQRQCNQMGIDYLYAYPRLHSTQLAPPLEDPILGLVLNGVDTRISVTTSGFGGLLHRWTRSGAPYSAVAALSVHGVLGHNPELLGEGVATASPEKSLFWVHDYFTFCASPQLAFNDLMYCSAPGPGSSACEICVHGTYRQSHLDRLATFMESAAPVVVAPSETARRTFLDALERSDISWSPSEVEVVPHGGIRWTGQRPALREGAPLTVAFVGHPVAHKGWLTFKTLADAFSHRPDYSFLQLGAQRASQHKFRYVKQTGPYSGDTTQVLRRAGVDVLFAASLWPETFHIAAYEAMAAGCGIVSTPASGHPYQAALDHGRLFAYESSTDILKAFDDGSVRQVVLEQSNCDRRIGDFSFTGLTPHFLRT